MQITITIPEGDSAAIVGFLNNVERDGFTTIVIDLTMTQLAEMPLEYVALVAKRPGLLEGSAIGELLSAHRYRLY